MIYISIHFEHGSKGLRLCFQQLSDILVGIGNSQWKGHAMETTPSEKFEH
jgi:hypothetical protein